MIEDPSGILVRVPELELVAEQHLPVRKAIESGNPFRIHRALFWTWLLGRAGSSSATVRNLLGNRRLFARPLKGTPWLSTLNSIGLSFVGESEPQSDGTFIATHAFVILFKVPLLPLGAYVVRPGDSSGMRRSWTIFARVPLGGVAWLWNRLAAAAAVASVVLGAAAAFHASRYQDVRVVNGFDSPAQVSIGKLSATVPASSDAVLNVPVGKHAARARVKDVEVDAADLDVSSGNDVFVWNVAGAAPVFEGQVTYSAHPSKNDDTPPTILCGTRLIVRRRVDYAFREPDKTVSVPKGSSGVRKSLVAYPRGEKDLLQTCFSLLARENRLKDALPFLEAYARSERWASEASNVAVTAAHAVSMEEMMRIARLARDARPDDVEIHRQYQWAATLAGLSAEAIEEYRKRAEAAPDSADAQYLHSRLLSGSEERPLVEKLAQRFPDHPYLLRSLVYVRFRDGEWDAATSAWDRLHARSPDHAAELADVEIWSLAALGKRAQAMDVAREIFGGKNEQNRRIAAERFARLASLERSGRPDELIEKLEGGPKGTKSWVLRQHAGLPIASDADGPGLRLYAAAIRDPAGAAKLAASASELDLFSLTAPTWMLLYLESVRAAKADAERSLLRNDFYLPGDRETLRRFARGEPVSIRNLDLTPEMEAAACLVRARNTSLPATERAALLDRARRLDVIHGAISEAIPGWKI